MQQRCKTNNLKKGFWYPDALAEEHIKHSQQWLKDKFDLNGLVSISTVLRLALLVLVRFFSRGPNCSE